MRPEQLYASIIQNATRAPKRSRRSARRRSSCPILILSFKVPVGEAPVKGPRAAKVTIIEFSDFQCPYCSRVVPTIKKLTETFANDVRIVQAQPAALPRPNAGRRGGDGGGSQGKFWEMHDKLFENQQALDRASLEKYAQDLGLNVEQFKGDLDSGKFSRR